VNLNEQNEYWHKWNRFQLRHEGIYTPKYNKALREQINQFIEAGTLMAVDSAPIYKVTLELYTTVSPIWAAASTLNLRRQKARAPMGFSQYIVDQMAIYYGIDFLNMSDNITQTTKDTIQAVLNQAALEGFGFDEVVRRLQSTELTRFRARLIARTETVGAANAASNIAAIKTGLLYDKIWISARDARTRPHHREVNQNVVGMSETFTVGTSQMQFPGDKDGGPNEVCNCFLPDQLTSVNPEIINKAFRSFYDGKVVTIEASNGNSFTCTPNHPILTTKGFRVADSLTKFDKLVYSSFINDKVSPDFNINNSKSTFEQIYNTLNEFRVSVRKNGSVMDFYGDGSNSDVNIVSIDGQLHNRVELGKPINNGLLQNTNFNEAGLLSNSSQSDPLTSLILGGFSHRYISAKNELSPIIERSVSHSNKHAFAPVFLDNSIPTETVNNNAPATSDISGDLFDRNIIIEHLDNEINVNNCADITSISHSYYKGFVYTLETTEGIYDINSFVAKNCRCCVAQIPKRDSSGRLIRV